MKKKNIRSHPKKPTRKKINGFFYFKKQLFVVSILIVLGLTFLFSFNGHHQNSHCANSISCIKDLSGQYDEVNKGTYAGKEITGPAIAGQPYSQLASANNVLGDNTIDPKHIYVDLTHQQLYAFENNRIVYSFTISSGKWNPTPTGEFRIWIKLRYTRMTGGKGADYYDLPNVPFTMYFYNDKIPKTDGYGIHGTYWHHNFGHPMSHGCINMKTSDAEILYNWADPPTTGFVTDTSSNNLGTPITIYGETPKN